jgi:hypothetical protein
MATDTCTGTGDPPCGERTPGAWLAFAFARDSGERTGDASKNAVLLVTLGEDILAAGAADDIMTRIAGDSLRAIVPEPDFSVAPDQMHSGRQAVQDSSKDVRVLKFSHRRNGRVPLESSIGIGRESFKYEPGQQVRADPNRDPVPSVRRGSPPRQDHTPNLQRTRPRAAFPREWGNDSDYSSRIQSFGLESKSLELARFTRFSPLCNLPVTLRK